ncbi:hypothetical protein [Cellvibrio japonicus]|uniref:Lipoprotein n=1 Tax=Cellvibrio japonicus (strain Ueda107) TaxID=498211 RepID=B3PLD7_CELJU|nr:hypothetical protein [Cellvibrio japonicus]ACE84503.1 hypothetical protein CJA_0961 [Cellvibrio japonicus Ueda107]QEI11588.1 hypothetical protein FY117_04665 [Cellvibrio japonicus]QEI15162.1 hypothetical protein FY116_04665 [Cellvibrio japonicus]QEI18742.1 hypothetical protein FY115_04665 [Cellvibrio japonicus]
MNTKTRWVKVIGIAGILLNCLATTVYAADQQRPPREDHGFGPPPEAINACSGLAEGDVCSFTGRNSETLAGQCATPPRNTDTATLACRPDNMPEPHQRPPRDNGDA